MNASSLSVHLAISSMTAHMSLNLQLTLRVLEQVLTFTNVSRVTSSDEPQSRSGDLRLVCHPRPSVGRAYERDADDAMSLRIILL